MPGKGPKNIVSRFGGDWVFSSVEYKNEPQLIDYLCRRCH